MVSKIIPPREAKGLHGLMDWSEAQREGTPDISLSARPDKRIVAMKNQFRVV
jgi:hypothetical protein